MATILLASLGSAIGGVFGPIGAALGQAAGAIAGNALENALLSPSRTVEGARLPAMRPFDADEGAPMTRAYGTVRLSGTMIWATRFEETKTAERHGGKALGGGTTVNRYAYFANVAFGLCEGPINGIRRIWADGRELDQTEFDFRVHSGTEDQLPDPLIAAKQGEDNTPAYRGLAYVVFERMPLERFGNRVPQLQFEVIRATGLLERELKAICIIPGATEHGYDPDVVTEEPAPGESRYVNRNTFLGPTDWAASIDELQAVAPSLRNVALVSSWFGDDLRAGVCRIRPGVEKADKPGISKPWSVGGLTRTQALEVSRQDGGAAYGGTPSDASLIGAMRDLASRGLAATLYPFVMMDIPGGNTLPDPWGGEAQAAYPWRGRITCDPAPGRPGSPDKTADAAMQVAAFMGNATAADFVITGDAITYTGDPDDFGYRRFILHHACLAAIGAADAMLVGSELRGLSSIRSGPTSFPFVDAMIAVLPEIRQLAGPAVKLVYAADWSEYFGHQPNDGSGDVLFHLDPLFAHAEIAAVGIDYYMPLADWRDHHADGTSPDGMTSAADRSAMRAALVSGERHDWYYASAADREAGIRAPITDGAYGKPWMFRPKDIAGWWLNHHVNRIGGVEQSAPTAWQPGMKPVWLTEIGCPAIDKGANQPNVFGDAKSSESAIPHFSNGHRDDLVQRAYLEALISGFRPDGPDRIPTANPLAPVTGQPMIPPERIYAWAWDARPFPAFPARSDLWRDGENWERGHWLNGRLGTTTLEDLVRAVAADHGTGPLRFEGCDGWLCGYQVPAPTTFRETIEPVLTLCDVAVAERADETLFFGSGFRSPTTLLVDDPAIDDRGNVLSTSHVGVDRLPAEAVLLHADPLRDHQQVSARAFVSDVGHAHQEVLSLPAAIAGPSASLIVSRWLAATRTRVRTATFALPPAALALEPGDVVDLGEFDHDPFRVTRIEDGAARRIEATAFVRPDVSAIPADDRLALPNISGPRHGKVRLVVFEPPHDLVPRGGSGRSLMVSAWARDWQRQVIMTTGSLDVLDTLDRPSTMGRVVEPLPGGPAHRWLRSAVLTVSIAAGALQSRDERDVLAGANRAVLVGEDGEAEFIRFRDAEEVSPGLWRLSCLLRGDGGSDDQSHGSVPAGTSFVLLYGAVRLLAFVEPPQGPVLLSAQPADRPVEPGTAASAPPIRLHRSVKPPVPVHLRVVRTPAGDSFTWTRQGRVDATDWAPAEIPLGEGEERYLVEIEGPSGMVRSIDLLAPHFEYLASMRAADGLAGQAYSVRVGQVGRLAGEALFARMEIAS